METFTSHFEYCYENDTTIEYVNTGLYSMLNCSFTSEDPDYGTDTIHFSANPAESMEKMAYDMLFEVRDFLDYRDGKVEASLQNVQNDYDNYSNSTLIAIEYALSTLSKDYTPNKRYATIREASDWVAKRMLENSEKTFAFCESDREEAKGNPSKHEECGGWHGIKRIPGFFDNQPDEFIVAVGYYGGGNVGFGYAYLDILNPTEKFTEVSRAIRKAICEATGWDSDNMIYIEEDEK